jgi:hypothetical protein
MTDDDLDLLLGRPLAALPDNGFSRRVMTAVAGHQKRRAQMWAAIQLAGVALVLAIAPFTHWGQTMETLGDAVLAWPVLLAAASSLALGWLAVQLLDPPPLRQL